MVAIHCAPEPREKREKGKKKGGSAKAAAREEVVGAKDDAVVFITDAGNAALHGFRSYTVVTHHCITIPSSTTPSVSTQFFPCSPPDSVTPAMALHTRSV